MFKVCIRLIHWFFLTNKFMCGSACHTSFLHERPTEVRLAHRMREFCSGKKWTGVAMSAAVDTSHRLRTSTQEPGLLIATFDVKSQFDVESPIWRRIANLTSNRQLNPIKLLVSAQTFAVDARHRLWRTWGTPVHFFQNKTFARALPN